MKIALLLTGQLRTCKMCKYLVKNTILNHYDVDVFMSIDSDNKLQCLHKNDTKDSRQEDIQEAIDFFRPIAHYINYNYDDEFSKLESVMDPNIINTIPALFLKLPFQQYYIVQKGYELLKNHVEKTNQQYDAIIRLRYDQFIWNDDNISYLESMQKVDNNILYNEYNTNILKNLICKLNIDTPKDNNIYVLGYGNFTDYNYVNDQLFIHSQIHIDTFYGFYSELLEITLDCAKTLFPHQGCYIEHCFYKFLIKHNLRYHKSLINGVFVRQKN